MYGIHHCVFFECLMNGSNHLQEADTGPSFLCPVCLNKLYYVMKFDIEERYRKMAEFWRSHGLTEEVGWLGTWLAIVAGPNMYIYIYSRIRMYTLQIQLLFPIFNSVNQSADKLCIIAFN